MYAATCLSHGLNGCMSLEKVPWQGQATGNQTTSPSTIITASKDVVPRSDLAHGYALTWGVDLGYKVQGRLGCCLICWQSHQAGLSALHCHMHERTLLGVILASLPQLQTQPVFISSIKEEAGWLQGVHIISYNTIQYNIQTLNPHNMNSRPKLRCYRNTRPKLRCYSTPDTS